MTDTHVFPEFEYWDEDQRKFLTPVGGLTRRELFAALCLQGRLGDPTWIPVTKQSGATEAVEWADSLIAALEGGS